MADAFALLAVPRMRADQRSRRVGGAAEHRGASAGPSISRTRGRLRVA